MRDLDPKDLDFLLALHQHGITCGKATVENFDPANFSTWPKWVMMFERLRSQLTVGLRNHATLDDFEIAIEELKQQIELWRIRNDPAFDPTLKAFE